MKLFDPRQVGLKRFAQLVGQHGEAIFHPFAFADDDLVLGKVEVFDAQADALHTGTCAARKRGASVRRRPLP